MCEPILARHLLGTFEEELLPHDLSLSENDRRADFLRASLEADAEGHITVRPFPMQDSSMLATLARADALVLRAPFAPALPAGAEVEAIMLGDLGV